MLPQRDIKPNIRLKPIKVRPHMFNVSTKLNNPGFVTIHFATPENIHFESSR